MKIVVLRETQEGEARVALMNVLLAEANVPYSSLYELEQINPEFSSTDVAVVIGANDVVNPDARDNPSSPIAGMPILEVDRSKSVVVLKRGQGKGFSGLENPLFFKPVTGMVEFPVRKRCPSWFDI